MVLESQPPHRIVNVLFIFPEMVLESQLSHKSVNLFCILVIVKDKVTDL